MKVESVFIPELSSRVKIYIINDKFLLEEELKNITTEISELSYKSWVLESFIIGINQIFNKWVLTNNTDLTSLSILKDTLFNKVIELNPYLNPNKIYISKANTLTLKKNKCKLTTCHTWAIKTDTSNLISLCSSYDYERILNNALYIEHALTTDYTPILEGIPIYIRIFEESSLPKIVSVYNPNTIEELKYFVVITCIDNFSQLYDLLVNTTALGQINPLEFFNLLYDKAVTHNSFLKLNLGDFSKIQSESLSATASNYTLERPVEQKIKQLSDVNKNIIIDLEKTLLSKLFGQDEAVKSICSTIKKAYLGIKNPKTPIGAFFFYGSTSTGKTELAKIIAKELTGTTAGLLKVSCGTLAEAHGIYTLIGSPPGYVGHENSGFLEQSFKNTKSKFKIILFDEVEKANSKIYDIVLEMLEEGEILLANGTVLDVSNCIIIFTSNMGQHEAIKASSIPGFSSSDQHEEKQQRIKSQFEKTLTDTLKPEFLARLQGVFYFKHLDLTDLYKVAKSCLENYSKYLKERKIYIDYDNSLIEYIINSCKKKNKNLHARHIRNFIDFNVLEDLGKFIIKESFQYKKLYISIEVREGVLYFIKN